MPARLRLGQVEAEEGDVGVDPPAEERQLLLGAERLRRLRPDRVDQRVGVAVQQLAADQQHDVRCRRRSCRRARPPGSTRGSAAAAASAPRCRACPRTGGSRCARVSLGNSRQSSSRGELVVEADHVRLDEARVRVEQRDGVEVDRPDARAAAARARGRAAPRTSAAGRTARTSTDSPAPPAAAHVAGGDRHARVEARRRGLLRVEARDQRGLELGREAELERGLGSCAARTPRRSRAGPPRRRGSGGAPGSRCAAPCSPSRPSPSR